MIGVIGINYKSSPIEIREKFSFNEQRIIEFGNVLRNKEGFSGIVVLSTCNRSEFYFQIEGCCDTAAFSFMLRSLKSFCEVTENIRDYFYLKAEEEAFRHLFHVVSGVNSMILGENQIVGQVKQALQMSQCNDLSDTQLNRLFTKSFEANKRIRTQTKINQGAFSISYAGVEKCLSIFPDIQDRKIFLIGAGETGTLTLKSLLKKGCKNIVITNRTLEKAVNLANQYEVKATPFESLAMELEFSDIVIISTGSQVPLVDKKMVEWVSAKRNHQKQLFIDLSVPHNIDPTVSQIENVLVYDVDDLQEVVNANQERRKEIIGDIDSIIDEYIADYTDWLSARNLSHIISTIKSNFNAVNQIELEGFKKVNKTNGNDMLDHYGTHISEKYTRLLIKNLKEVTNNGRKMEYVKVLNSLFELS